MVTVSKIVEKLVMEKPFLQEALSRGVINNAALAQEILPTVQKEYGKKVKFSAVNMAIRRLAEKLNGSFVETARFGQGSDVSARSDLFSITLYKTEVVQKKLNSIYGLVSLNKGDLLTVTQGLHEVMIISNNRHKKRILEHFASREKKRVIDGLGCVTVGIPEESVDTVGLFYVVTRAINWANINIVDIVSTLTEMTFVIEEDAVPRAFEILVEVVKD